MVTPTTGSLVNMRLKSVMKIVHILLVTTIVSMGIMMIRAIRILVSLLLNEGKM